MTELVDYSKSPLAKLRGISDEIEPHGIKFNEFQKQLAKTQWLSKEQLEELQLAKLKKIVSFAEKNVPFYKNAYKKAKVSSKNIKALEDIEKFPIVDKAQIIENPNNFIAKNYSEFYPFRFSSGGTTGKKLEFYIGSDAWDIEKAAIWRHFSWANYTYKDKCIMLYPFDDSIKEHYDPILNWNIINTRILNDITFKYLLKRIIKIRPKALWGYPSVLDSFAKYLEQQGVSLNIPIILTTSESLHNFQKERIEKEIGGKIFDWYGQGEHVASAAFCEKQKYHINMEACLIEFTKNGNSVKLGKPGQIIGTCLDNYSMPLIRYNTEDLAIQSTKSCMCQRGLPIIESIIGRIHDLIYTKDGPLVIKHSMLTINNMKSIKNFQIVQENLNKFIINIEKGISYSEKDALMIQNELKHYIGKTISVEIALVPQIKKTERGKQRLVVSNVSKKKNFNFKEMKL
jgi:phenylacetate-CoA ligase